MRIRDWFIKLTTLGCLALTQTAAAHDKGGTNMTTAKHETATYTVTYAAGPQWKANTPPEGQDLAGHFGWVKKLFDEGVLLTNGMLADGHGFYVFAATDAAHLDRLVASDPAVDAGVLQVVAKASWLLVMNNLSAKAQPGGVFVLNYRPGPKWKAHHPLMEQDLGHHLEHVGKALAAGLVLAGGPVDAHQGRYVLAGERAQVDSFVDKDPGVSAGTFRVEVIAWQVFNRQAGMKER